MTDSDKDPAPPTPDNEPGDLDWASALSEETRANAARENQAAGLRKDNDDWAAALAEQTAAQRGKAAPGQRAPKTPPTAGATAPASGGTGAAGAAAAAGTAPGPGPGPASSDRARRLEQRANANAAAAQVFQPLSGDPVETSADIDMVMDIPVQLSVELGRTRLTIKNILQLGQGSVVELDGLAGEPMDIYVNGYLIAQGEVVVVDDKYGIRVTDIITPADRIHRLNSRR
ncbi:MAG: flagellar motor switch protein FliN [Burkholderiaceae bacterium]